MQVQLLNVNQSICAGCQHATSMAAVFSPSTLNPCQLHIAVVCHVQVRGGARNLVLDLGLVLEGHNSWELPEELVGAVR